MFPELHSQTRAQVSYSRFTDETLRDDCVAMTGRLLAVRADHLVYSCGGLMVKIFDKRGDSSEEIIVRMTDEGKRPSKCQRTGQNPRG